MVEDCGQEERKKFEEIYNAADWRPREDMGAVDEPVEAALEK